METTQHLLDQEKTLAECIQDLELKKEMSEARIKSTTLQLQGLNEELNACKIKIRIHLGIQDAKISND